MAIPKWYWVSAEDEFEVPALTEFTRAWTPAKPNMDTEVWPDSEIFIREIVQNFKDAADEWPTGSPQGKPKLTFTFVTVEGAEARRLRSELNLESLSETYKAIGTKATSQMRIRHDSQVFKADTEPLTLLVASEQNTSGMFGAWHRTRRAKLENGLELKRKMAKAFLSVSRSYATSSKGLGSFGEGKKAILNISGPKCVLAYTSFDPALSDDGAWSRFAGFTFWQDFKMNDELFSGLAMIGDDRAGGLRPEPYKNEDATFLIEKLNIPGLIVRKEGENKDWGTTMVFVDPSITPGECAESIVRNWWPLLDTGKVEFSVFEGEKEVLLPDLPALKPFRELAGVEEQAVVNDWQEAEGAAVEIKELDVKTCTGPAGKLKLAIDMRPSIGFSIQGEDDNRSFVALIREGMVINYEPINEGRSKDRPPFVRGVFEVTRDAHAESESLLRMSEPPLHNVWRGIYGDNESAAKHARAVMSDIKSLVSEMKEKYRHSAPEHELDFELFNEAFSLRSKAGPVPPPTPPRRKTLFTVESEKLELTETEDHLRKASSTQALKLSKLGISKAEQLDRDVLEVLVSIGWEVLEEDKFVPAFDGGIENVKFPEHFQELGPGQFQGTVSVTKSSFTWESPAYGEPWSVKPAITIELLDDSEGEADGE